LGGLFAICVADVSQNLAYFLKIMKINRYGGAFFLFGLEIDSKNWI